MLTAPPAPIPPSAPELCHARGGKYLTPPLSEAAICQRFLSAIATVPEVTGIAIEVLPQGVLTAAISHAGTRRVPTDYGLSVMDRAMTVGDLDALARSVVADLAPH